MWEPTARDLEDCPRPARTGRAEGNREGDLRGGHLDQHLAHGVQLRPHLIPSAATVDVGEVVGNNRLVLHLLDTVRTT
jgi:hypothetical protein